MTKDSFTVKKLPRIVFEKEGISRLPELIESRGSSVLVVTGGGSFTRSPHWQVLEGSLQRLGVEMHHESIEAEPTPEGIDDICRRHRRHNIEVVTAIGGGSVLDGGKAAAAMLKSEGSVVEYLEGVGTRKPDGTKVPFIAVPTTAGTGSETTANAVLSRVGPGGFKKSLRHENYTPDIALIDPLLTLGLPLQQTAYCCMDAFTQLVESYLSTAASFFSDDLAWGALRRLKPSLPRLSRAEVGLEDRVNMSYAACVSGITLSHAGLGVVHGFASTIGGRFAIPHGLVCATLMAEANAVTLEKLRNVDTGSLALDKYAHLGRLLSEGHKRSDSYYQDAFIAILQGLTADCGIEPLGRFGITAGDLLAMARASSCKNNPADLGSDERQAILAARL